MFSGSCLGKKRKFTINQLLEVCYVIFKPTSSWSTSSSSTFNSERSVASFLSPSLALVSSHSSFLHLSTVISTLSGSGLARRGMGGTGLLPFRPPRGARCLTRVGFSCRGEGFSCRLSPGKDTSGHQFFGRVAGTWRSPEKPSCPISVPQQKTPFTGRQVLILLTILKTFSDGLFGLA